MKAPSLATLGTVALLVVAAGCRDSEPPTAPEPGPAVTGTATAALLFRNVNSGGDLACAVTTDDRGYCWDDAMSPVAAAGDLTFQHISTSGTEGHTCGVTTTDRIYCWGHNYYGQLGDGTRVDRSTPVLAAGGRRFRQVRVGAQHTCAINPYDKVFCWGGNGYGQLGDGTTTLRLTPTRVRAVGITYLQLSAGDYHNCAVTTNHQVQCWGYNYYGQIGDGSSEDVRPVPRLVLGTRLYRQVEAGWMHTCGVSMDNRAYCWGRNSTGQLGIGKTGWQRGSPVPVSGGLQFRAVNAGASHTCGIGVDDRAYCWGSNYGGWLGDGTTTMRVAPVAVLGGLQFKGVSAGGRSSCGVASNSRVYCWGYYVTTSPVGLPGPI